MTDEEFSGWWVALTAALEPGTTIGHWRADKGELPGSFVVTSIDPYAIRIEGPKHAIYQRIIDRGDFRDILDVWDKYRLGQVLRTTIESMTKHSTYVISIIRWLEAK